MCGIAGVVCFEAGIVDSGKLKRMADVLAHRGPDDGNTWINVDQKIGFAHRRLSIIDLSDLGKQPMHYLEDRYTIVFNGEIYNYIELKSDLENAGYRFNSHSDTEVLMAMFNWKQEKCLAFLDGMFAFAIWDNLHKKLFCARDRFGEKPFFYYFKNGQFIFASEIKAIKVYIEKLSPNLNIIQSHLTTGRRIEDHETCFNDVKVLPPANAMYLSTDGIQQFQYWDINLNNEIKFSDVREYSLQFEKLFRESINRRLRTDVPYGSSLSGGLDSSTVVCYINEMASGDFKTFSARFNGPTDEGKWISKVTEKLSLANFTVYPDPVKMIEELPSLIYHQEYPIGSSSIYAQWCVMKLVNENNVKVLLDGQGADEYLAGYNELKYFAIWEFYRKGMFKRFLHERQLFKRNYGQNASIGWSFIADPLLEIIGKKRQIFNNGMSLKEQLKYYTRHQLGELLRYADRNSMAHSVEVRLPFLWHELVQFVFNLPVDMIYREGKTKYVMREAAKNVLPEAIYNRTDKIGFAPPQELWMKQDSVIKKVKKMNDVLIDYKLSSGNDPFRNMVCAELLTQFISS